MIYLLILIYVVLWTYICDIKKRNKYRIVGYWSICILFILLSGLRYHIGVDSIAYQDYWNCYPDLWNYKWGDIQTARDKFETFERYHVGWFIYVMLIQSISKNFILVQFSNAILINIAIFKLAKKYSHHPFLSILIYYCTFTFIEFNFELMRETVAVSVFLLWGISAYINRKWSVYFLIVTISYSIHPSAVVMFLLPMIRNLRLPIYKYIIFLIILSFIISIYGVLLLGNLVDIILGDSPYGSSYFEGMTTGNNFNYLLMQMYKPILLLVFTICLRKHIRYTELMPVLFFSISVLAFGAVIYTAQRFVNYLIIVDYIIITDAFYYLIKKYHTMFIAILILFIYYLPAVFQFSTNKLALARYYPYQWIINPEQTKEQKQMEGFMRQGVRGI